MGCSACAAKRKRLANKNKSVAPKKSMVRITPTVPAKSPIKVKSSKSAPSIRMTNGGSITIK